MPRYSLVVPAYNEEKALPLFYEAVVPVMESLNEEFEIIFVNDGSRDATKEILAELAAKDKRVKVCNFSRNFGQQAALLCGFEEAKGEAVIAMDADLQDPPEVALQMIEKWKEGYDVVARPQAQAKGGNGLQKGHGLFLLSVYEKDYFAGHARGRGDFKLYDRKAVDAIVSLGEHDRLLRAQVTWVGFKQTIIEFDRPERVAGETPLYPEKNGEACGERGVSQLRLSPDPPLEAGDCGGIFERFVLYRLYRPRLL